MDQNTHQHTVDLLARAIALHQNGDLPAAAALYLEILAVAPDHFDALHLLGVYALQTGDLPAAYDLLERAVALKPDDATAQMHFAHALQRQGLFERALRTYRHAVALAPNDAMALTNYANLLLEMKRHPEALPLLERAVQLAPDYAEAYNNLGSALVDLRRYDEALVCIERALELDPDYMVAHYNRGNALQSLRRIDAALRSYERALALAPGDVDANVNAGICKLLSGALEQGWPQYEWRWRKPSYQTRMSAFEQPWWRGETALRDTTLLLHAEQGYGDTLQLCRYAALLAEQGARVLLRVQPALKTLLAGLPGVQQVLSEADPLPAFDLHCPLMSLPLAMRTSLATIPSGAAYVHADPARVEDWGRRLGPATRPRIGLAWSGNANHDNDRQRSIPLAQLRALLTADADFFSLQKDPRAVDRIVLANDERLHDHAAQLTDFADTAALLAHMDLVISVDTSVAHLAGAMGKPVWILLPFVPDWRWLLERDDSPWYPSARLFRQSRDGNWDGALADLARALADNLLAAR